MSSAGDQNGIVCNGPLKTEKNGFKIIDCVQCGFAHVFQLPSAEDLVEIYKYEYYNTEKPDYINHYVQYKVWWDSVYDERLVELEEFLPGKTNISILDVGSGPGLFLDRARYRGWEVQGIEPALKAYEYSVSKLGLPVKNCYLDSEVAETLPTYDVVHLGEVLEHLPDPHSMLRIIRKKLLKPGGLIAVVVPNDYNNFQNILASALGYEEWWVTPPHHLNYFNVGTIERFVRRQGFELLSTSTSFPIDIFLMMGMNYVGNETLGRQAHSLRKTFDLNLHGLEDERSNNLKKSFYKKMAELGLGREVWCVGRAN